MDGAAPGALGLPELAAVHWRAVVDESRLRRAERLWTATSLAHAVPLLITAIGLAVLIPLTIPIGLILLVHAWAIPELYANRGANVLKGRRRRVEAAEAEVVALGLLGDLVGHDSRRLLASTGLVLERGRLGVWLIGEAGAVLVRPGGRRLHCYCVRVPDPDLPSSDRKAHLLLALREDEAGFATVANRAFAGAPWRLARRTAPAAREALGAAVTAARSQRPEPARARRYAY